MKNSLNVHDLFTQVCYDTNMVRDHRQMQCIPRRNIPMRKILLLTTAIVMVMTVNGVYAGGGFKKNAYSGNPNAKQQPVQARDVSGIVYEVSYSPPYIVIGEKQFNIDNAVFKSMNDTSASIYDIKKGKKVKLVIDASGIVTDVFLYEEQQ
ncbi:hypothetical protein MBAV_000541 [Candidatus Magnetobacterium bavaricum]|uniref:Uncharacterized protein n=1 Tax=Candidatus Magnetobacterium bavaricum TaxID=29290 RepID=A0A0F3GZG9_9BACT|nr:hypothetical protein MBAV_000541 [Candidatus Magnetobacterium bavaricum]